MPPLPCWQVYRCLMSMLFPQGGAFLGALLSMLIVYGTFAKSRTSISTVLLAGSAVLFSSLIMLLQYICDPRNNKYSTTMEVFFCYRIQRNHFCRRWLSVWQLQYPHPGAGYVLLGDEVSREGVDAAKVRKLLFVAVSFMTASCSVLMHPTGFCRDDDPAYLQTDC